MSKIIEEKNTASSVRFALLSSWIMMFFDF
ncbi:hypothetical protein ACJIZ3_009678 [Penstemon smallii]|uniref:MFS transporter n=1 Tax=Penstemon smallii TaxID=265156 RepID=A0ABD3TDQ6_9LAMI